MKLSLQPNRATPGRTLTSYTVTLRSDERAVLEQVDRDWRLIIFRPGRVEDRGLFASTHDILMLLEAEYFPAAADEKNQDHVG
jgi:hypothetical protein